MLNASRFYLGNSYKDDVRDSKSGEFSVLVTKDMFIDTLFQIKELKFCPDMSSLAVPQQRLHTIACGVRAQIQMPIAGSVRDIQGEEDPDCPKLKITHQALTGLRLAVVVLLVKLARVCIDFVTATNTNTITPSLIQDILRQSPEFTNVRKLNPFTIEQEKFVVPKNTVSRMFRVILDSVCRARQNKLQFDRVKPDQMEEVLQHLVAIPKHGPANVMVGVATMKPSAPLTTKTKTSELNFQDPYPSPANSSLLFHSLPPAITHNASEPSRALAALSNFNDSTSSGCSAKLRMGDTVEALIAAMTQAYLLNLIRNAFGTLYTFQKSSLTYPAIRLVMCNQNDIVERFLRQVDARKIIDHIETTSFIKGSKERERQTNRSSAIEKIAIDLPESQD